MRTPHYTSLFEVLSIHLGKSPFGLSTYGGRGQRSAAGVQCPAVAPTNMEGCLQTQLPDHSICSVELLYNLLLLQKNRFPLCECFLL